MKLVCGVGFNDGEFPSKVNGKHAPQYDAWRSMVRRCYSPEFHRKRPNYIGCSVSENFKSYSYFYKWYNDQNPVDGVKYQLDKDLLVKGNLFYSEDNCVLLPQELNSLIVRKEGKRGEFLIGVSKRKDRDSFTAQMSLCGGNKLIGYFKSEIEAFMAYKYEKEKHVREMALLNVDRITNRAYEALMSYSVEITD